MTNNSPGETRKEREALTKQALAAKSWSSSQIDLRDFDTLMPQLPADHLASFEIGCTLPLVQAPRRWSAR